MLTFLSKIQNILLQRGGCYFAHTRMNKWQKMAQKIDRIVDDQLNKIPETPDKKEEKT